MLVILLLRRVTFSNMPTRTVKLEAPTVNDVNDVADTAISNQPVSYVPSPVVVFFACRLMPVSDPVFAVIVTMTCLYPRVDRVPAEIAVESYQCCAAVPLATSEVFPSPQPT